MTTKQRKTVSQLNQEAGEWVAFYFLKHSEEILAGGRIPCPLSEFDRAAVRGYIPELFYEQTERENPRWWVSAKNFPHILSAAVAQAKQTLSVLGERDYPLTLEHFSKSREEREAMRLAWLAENPIG